MPFDLNQAKGHLKNLGYEDNSDEMKALLGFASMLDSGGDQPKPITPMQGILATIGAGAQAGLARLGGSNHFLAVNEAMAPINRLMAVNDNAFARSKEISAALAQIALKDRFSTIAENRKDARNKQAAEAFGKAIYGDESAPTPAVSAPVPTITPPAAQGQPGAPAPASVAAPGAAPSAPPAAGADPAAPADVPGITVEGGTPSPAPAQAAPSPTPAPQPTGSADPAVGGGSQFNRMMATLKTPQAKRHFQLAIASIQQQMATGNMKDGATIDAAYKAATDIDRATLAQDPEFQAGLEEAKTTGKKRGEMAAEKLKASDTARKVGVIMDDLESLGSDPSIGGAIGPLEGQGWAQTAKSSVPIFSKLFGADKSFDLNQKIKSATRNLELIMTRLTMQGQGQISEGERAIVRDAIGNLELSTDRESYVDNVRYLRELVSEIFGQDLPSDIGSSSSMKARAQAAIAAAREERAQPGEPELPDGSKAAGSVDSGKSRTATNQQTGEKFELRDGQWVSIGVPAPKMVPGPRGPVQVGPRSF